MNRSLFLNWTNKCVDQKLKKHNNNVILNFGPQHPAAHGVLRLILQMNGEVVERVDTHIGLLHRGTEKLIESKHYEKSIPYFDRLDYVSMMSQEHAYCLSIEHLQNIKNISIFTSLQRVLFDELTRLLNHFLAVACHALDIGSMSSIFWAFEEREKIMEFYERVSGARMHAAYHKPSILFNKCVDYRLLSDIIFFVKQCYITLNEIHNILTYNKIWKQRLVNIGTYSFKDVQNYGLTGVLSRCVGVKRDVRLSLKDNYSGYNTLNFKSFISLNGDSYDRFLIRMYEMGESLNIVNQVVNFYLQPNHNINPITLKNYNPEIAGFGDLGFVNTNYKTIDNNIIKKQQYSGLFLNSKKNKNKLNTYTYMEDLIEHFVNWHSGLYIMQNATTVSIESPKGEFGVSLISDGTNKPFRCKIRSPSYHNLQFLPKLIKGHFISDLSAIIGTIDIVFGEIDK